MHVVACVKHEVVAVSEEHDRAGRVWGDGCASTICTGNDPAQSNLLSFAGYPAFARQVAGDRRAVPSGSETLGVELSKPRAGPDGFCDGDGGGNAACSRPVRVCTAVQRAFGMKALPKEEVGQIQDVDPL